MIGGREFLILAGKFQHVDSLWDIWKKNCLQWKVSKNSCYNHGKLYSFYVAYVYKNAYAGPHTAVAPSGNRRNLREKNLFFTWPYRGHRRNPFFERRFSSTIKIGRTNTAVFGISYILCQATFAWPSDDCRVTVQRLFSKFHHFAWNVKKIVWQSADGRVTSDDCRVTSDDCRVTDQRL